MDVAHPDRRWVQIIRTGDGCKSYVPAMGANHTYRRWVQIIRTGDGCKSYVPAMSANHTYRRWVQIIRTGDGCKSYVPAMGANHTSFPTGRDAPRSSERAGTEPNCACKGRPFLDR
jgi:hypothetical protein